MVSIILFANFNQQDKWALIHGRGKSIQDYNSWIAFASWAMMVLCILLNLVNQFLFLIFILSSYRLVRFLVRRPINRVPVLIFATILGAMIQISLFFIEFEMLGAPASKMAQDSHVNQDENCMKYFFEHSISKESITIFYFISSRLTFFVGLYFWLLNAYLMYH